MATKPIYLTDRGRQRLAEQLAFLRHVKRLELVEALHEAIEGGDSLENSEYMLVREELIQLDGRIADLEYLLAHAEAIAPPKGELVQLGSIVVIQEDDGEPEEYTIVGSAEADPDAGMISDQSPLGRALMNRSAGDQVQITAPAGLISFRLLSIR